MITKIIRSKKSNYFLLISVLLILMILLSSCSAKKSSPSEKTTISEESSVDKEETLLPTIDNPFYYNLYHHIAETDNGYFIMSSGILHYLDKETGKVVVFSNDSIQAEELLNKVYQDGEQHDAYFGDNVSIHYFNEHLYTLESVDYLKGDWEVIKVDPATMQRQRIGSIKSMYGDFAVAGDKIYTLYAEVENDEKAVRGYVYDYFLAVYDLEAEQSEEAISVPVSEDFRENQITAPRYDVSNNMIHFNLNYSAETDTDLGFVEKTIYVSYDVSNGEFSFETLLEYPKDNEKIRNLFELDGIRYYSYLSFPLPDDQNGDMEAWYVKKDKEQVSDKYSLPANYYIETNGKDIYAIPAVLGLSTPDYFSQEAFKVYKVVGDELEVIADISDEEAAIIQFPMEVCIGTNGDIFLMVPSGEAFYQIVDNQIVVKFDYLDVYENLFAEE
ncbi:MAG TPA: hypothetical protein GXZ43_05815 [Clostridiaceae bacterium]|nr:hypothetical protein [Clostridiaceae bacterium]